MNCERVEVLLIEWVLEPLRDPAADWRGVRAHLQTCPDCAASLQRLRQDLSAIDAAMGRGADAPGCAADLVPPQPGNPPHLPRTHGGTALGGPNGRHRPWRLPPRRRVVPLLAAMAACLLLAVWCPWSRQWQTAFPLAGRIDPADGDRGRAGLAMATPYDEQGRPGRPFSVGAGDPVVAGPGRGVQLDVWGRHSLHLDPGTQLALNETQGGGCVIALSRGRVFISIHRAADEGRCEMVTPHARVVVLGTVFTVASTLDATRLSVSRGQVRMSTPAGASQTITAGQTWMTAGGAILPDGGDSAVADLATGLLSDPLRALQQSAWYRHRFGSLLHLRDYLAEQDVAADEVSLLAVSAEPWCLQRPRTPGVPDYRQRKAGLQRAALAHGCRVEWPCPSTREQAVAIVADALREGSLVLAYGLAEGPLRIRRSEDLAPPPHAGDWSYRFLTEPAATAFALCVISRPSGEGVPLPVLAREAIADVQSLLGGLEDPDYDVGAPAVQLASFVSGASEAISSVAAMKALTALSRLGPACQEWLCSRAGRNIPGLALYSQLDGEIAAMFATRAFEETHCRQAQLAESADRCAATLRGLARTLGAAASD